MSTTKPPAPPAENPAEIAREAFRQLATRRMAPTPQNYTLVYNEIAGIVEPQPVAAEPAPDEAVEHMLAAFATKLHDSPGELHEFGRRFQRAAKARDWESYARALTQLVEKHFRKTNAIELVAPSESPEAKQCCGLGGTSALKNADESPRC